MACFSGIHQAIARLQAVSASHLQVEPVCVGPFRPPFEKRLHVFAHFKRPELSAHPAVRSSLVVFAAAGQDTATPTLVLQEVDFAWKGSGSQVFLTGDFFGWDTKVSLDKGTDGVFHCKQKLLPGTYKYKYIIDGKWAHSPDSPMVEDGQGGYNNQITVTDGPLAPATLPSKQNVQTETVNPKENLPPETGNSNDLPSKRNVQTETVNLKENPPAETGNSNDLAEVVSEAAESSVLPKMMEEPPEAMAPPFLPKKDVESSNTAAPPSLPKTVEEAPKVVPPSKQAEQQDLTAAAPPTSPETLEKAPKTVTPRKASEEDSKGAAPPKTVEERPKSQAPPKASEEDSKGAAPPKTAEESPKSQAPPKIMEPSQTAVGSLKSAAEAEKAAVPDPPKTVEGVPKASPESPKEVASKPVSPPKAAPSARAKKAEKPYPQIISEDVVPKVKVYLQKHEGLSNVEVDFKDNQLEGSFLKNSIVYTFWAFFPDGKLEGARGFSVSSHGAPPSTIEPFLIDERRITADLIAFWVLKRLASQRIITY